MVRICGVAALVVLCGSLVSAQERAPREGGGGGRGGFGGGRFDTKVGLLRMEEVQTELGLSDEQKTKAAEIADSARGRRGGGGGGGGEDWAARAEARRKRMEEAEAKAAELLDDTQEARLAGLYIQRVGVRAVSDAKVAELLALSDEQKGQITKVQEEQMAEFRALFEAGGLGEGSGEKMQEIGKQTEEKLTAVLTEEQKTKLEELKGEPFEFPRRENRRNRDA